MKKNIKNIIGFTLIEVVVSVTILSIIMVSVISIYISMTDVTLKSDINRSMQENLKNVVEKISEDIRVVGVQSVSDSGGISPFTSKRIVSEIDSTSQKYGKGDILTLNNGKKYFLAKSDGIIVSNHSDCQDIKTTCYIFKSDGGRITNSNISIEEMDFYLSNDSVPKVTISLSIRPAIKRGVKSNLIENSKLNFQTTISERPLNK